MTLQKAKTEKQIVGNTGMYYVCYQLSARGWNVMPTARNARGIDVVAYAPDDDSHYFGIQVKTLSSRNAVPVGKSKDNIIGQYWVIVLLSNPDKPLSYILTSDEARDLAHPCGKNDKVSYWIEPRKYAKPEYQDVWAKIFPDNEGQS